MFTRIDLQHIVAWMLFFGYESMMAFIIAPPQDWWEPFLFLIPEALFFYTYRALLRKFSAGFLSNVHWRKLLPAGLLLLFFFCITTIGMRFLFSHWEQQQHPPGHLRLYIASAFFRGIYLALLSSFLWLAESIINKNKLLAKEQLRLKEQEIEMMQMRQDTLASRNELYKAQIKPHILFNTLNFVHNQVADNPEASDSILLLTDIMRFALEHNDERGLILIEDEWTQVINFIKLQKMRFEKSMFFDIAFVNRNPNLKVPPLIVLTLVENMFMHGNLFDNAVPASLRLTTEEQSWQLKTSNKKRSGKNIKDGHNMGLANIKSRLEFYYQPENVSIVVKEDSSVFMLKLEVKLNEPKLI